MGRGKFATRLIEIAGGSAAISASPETDASFFGKAAKTADQFMLSVAQKMEHSGIPAEDIWKKTGWGRGADSQWRFEVSDDSARITPSDEQTVNMLGKPYNRLDEILDHGDLMRSHDVGDITVRGESDLGGGFAGVYQPTSDSIHLGRDSYAIRQDPYIDDLERRISETMASDEYQKMIIDLANQKDIDPNNLPPLYERVRSMENDVRREKRGFDKSTHILASDDTKSILLHELQHAIQRREGFATGGNPAAFSDPEGAKIARDALSWRKELLKARADAPDADISALENRVVQWYSDNDAMDWLPSREARSLAAQPNVLFPDKYPEQSAVDGYDSLVKKVQVYGLDAHTEPLNPHEIYNRLAGEVEARNVQTRMTLTPSERRASPPWETEDVPRSQQIVLGGTGAAPGLLAAGASQADSYQPQGRFSNRLISEMGADILRRGGGERHTVSAPVNEWALKAAEWARQYNEARKDRLAPAADIALPLGEMPADLLTKYGYGDKRTAGDYIRAFMGLL